ncbi:tRNA (adenosine(37)-N6)-threonylcarbamoyltransferase complex ATPase subunit type 1 TsaE [Salininema proteolyticum]|uniref:tRNA threonylcarbamoyladenosine biosynthesis protein TsaE n=1 Tax=Salininema proteolyticum TaxID=1607685 RepID=A0ABV8TTG5_9ACTN
MRLTTTTAEDTHEFGKRLAGLLQAGDLIILTGPLGAGKTALTQGIGEGLDVSGRITSPTFIIARSHRPGAAGLPLIHVDAYRLGGLDELDDLDLDTDVARSVTVVEWGAGLAEHLGESHLEITLARNSDDSRDVELIARGGDWAERLSRLPVGAAC